MIFAASVAAVAVLVALAWLLGFKGAPRLANADEACAIADAALYGFEASEVILDDGNTGATLLGADGRKIRIAPLGDRWVVRAG